jgi:hypothetical protein
MRTNPAFVWRSVKSSLISMISKRRMLQHTPQVLHACDARAGIMLFALGGQVAFVHGEGNRVRE